ncbi:hypothetical protein PAESOLCIP111_03977 [Paenibacillus solanacearum]|uniref:Gp5/Type VI secretion system Vgr protein OB-fold domain-containing protein n=1 Tax=Paenibacillus solanacearum TaxID=2048548 RepID=A0A916NJS3_9BACL|nr:phage baseplate assembly protein V [Paenibacillus solanacearum]CAG7638787.1 hypothetical protein PAESOLCIP111_03977 [Paenibacillus solanacearum]
MNGMFDSLYASDSSTNGLVQGVYVGLVTDNKDPEKLGRVKIEIPIFDDKNALDWARVTSLMAGKSRGMLFVPEVGDEVLVAFELGDIRKPIVIGCLWSKKEPPPDGKDDQNNIRKIASRLGHEIVFDDTEGDGKLTVGTKSGHKLELLEKTDRIRLQEKNGKSVITIQGGTGDEIEIKSGVTTIKIGSNGDAIVESAKSIKIKSAAIAIEATASLDLKASGALNMKSDGLITIKGSIVKLN